MSWGAIAAGVASRLPFVARVPWRLLGAAALAAAAGFGGYRLGARLERGDCDRAGIEQRDQRIADLEEQLREAREIGEADAAAVGRFSRIADLAIAEAESLRAAVAAARPALVTRTEAPADAHNRCSVPALSPRFRLCHDAAATGDPAARAACEAGGGTTPADPGGVPASGLVRPSDP